MAIPDQSYAHTEPEPGSEGVGAPLKEKPLTWVLLAAKFGVSVNTVHTVWRKREDAPKECNYEVWAEYVKKHNLASQIRRLGGSELRDEKTKHEIELIKAKVAREQRRVIERGEVDQLLLHIATEGRTVLYNLMESELPPKLDGMGAAQMRPILREAADTIADRMAGLIERFKEQ